MAPPRKPAFAPASDQRASEAIANASSFIRRGGASSFPSDVATDNLNILHVHQVPGNTCVPVDALAEARIVTDIVRQSFPHNDAAERLVSGIPDGVRKAALAIANEVSWADRNGFLAEVCRGLACQHEDTFVFMEMAMVFGRLVARRDLDKVKPETCEARKIAQRLVDPFGLWIQEMGFLRPLPQRDLGARNNLGIL